MPGKKGDQIKIYMVIGLALVLVIAGYFRFMHKKATGDANRTPSTVPLAKLDVPQVGITMPQNAQRIELPVNGPLRAVIRDIFAPLKSPPKAESQPTKEEPSKPIPSLKLKGTIVGGRRPIAIINDQFVGLDDWIGEYKVVRIGKKEVLLDSGDEKIKKLEILKIE